MILLLYHVFFISASVVAGVLGNPIGTKGYYKDDADTLYGIENSGIYTINSSVGIPTNIPDGVKYGILIVEGARDNYTVQRLQDTTNGTSYIRLRSDYSWKSWQRLDNFGYNSLAELATGVAGVNGYGFKTGMLNVNADDLQQNAILLNSNYDSTLPAAYGTLITFAPNTSHVTQLYSVASDDTNLLYFRQKTASIWSSWKQL